MSKKRISAPFYTEIRRGESAIFKDTRLPNGWLYANGKYRTKIKPEKLPDTYLPLKVYDVVAYVRLDGVRDVVYHPNCRLDRMHKDDFLYVSYSTQIKSEVDQHGCIQYHDYDVVLWESTIVQFIRAIRKLGEYDIESVAAEVMKRERFFVERYSEEHKYLGSSSMLLEKTDL